METVKMDRVNIQQYNPSRQYHSPETAKTGILKFFTKVNKKNEVCKKINQNFDL